MKDKIIIIPTYNERENVANMITQVFALEGNFEILIVDDSSPDGTASIVKEEMGKYPERLHLLERKGNSVWVRLILQASNGVSLRGITTFSRWIATLVIL